MNAPLLYWVNAQIETPTKFRPVIVHYQGRRGRRTFHIAIHTGETWIFPDCFQKRIAKNVKFWATIPEVETNGE